jgi:phage tail protein X
MTRETKIGLLVGLAFIIVIGILLSDHLTSSTEPPPATLAKTGENVRQAVSVPGGTQPPITPVVTPPQVQPQQPVPTPRELAPQTPATAIVQVGGPAPDAAPPDHPQVTAPPAPAPPAPTAQGSEPPISVVSNDPPIDIASNQQQSQASQSSHVPQPTAAQQDQPGAGAESTNGTLTRIAQQHGEALVTITPTGQQQPLSGAQASWTNTQTGLQTGTKDYTAEPGDSVSRMAAKLLGANTKANREAIIKANPSLQQNPNNVIAGKTYRIPTAAGASAPPASPSGSIQPVQQPPPAHQLITPQGTATPRTVGAGEYWYTVKDGDTLSRIAREQLGQDDAAIPAIMELNRDVLKDSNRIYANMKIRLPGRPVARAN